jgi:hypothetical protein
MAWLLHLVLLFLTVDATAHSWELSDLHTFKARKSGMYRLDELEIKINYRIAELEKCRRSAEPFYGSALLTPSEA